jgi:hypothetical protein
VKGFLTTDSLSEGRWLSRVLLIEFLRFLDFVLQRSLFLKLIRGSGSLIVIFEVECDISSFSENSIYFDQSDRRIIHFVPLPIRILNIGIIMARMNG